MKRQMIKAAILLGVACSGGFTSQTHAADYFGTVTNAPATATNGVKFQFEVVANGTYFPAPPLAPVYLDPPMSGAAVYEGFLYKAQVDPVGDPTYDPVTDKWTFRFETRIFTNGNLNIRFQCLGTDGTHNADLTHPITVAP